jgi:sugar phosphate permease
MTAPSTQPATAGAAATATARYRWVMLGLTTLADLGMATLSEAVPTLVPFIRSDLQLTRAQVGMLTAAPRFGQGASALCGGIALDTLGVRPCLAVGLALLAAGLLAFAQAPAFAVGLAALVLGGIGTGIAGAGTTLALLRWFPLRGRATAVGLKEASVPLFGAVAALILPAVALQVGWRAAVLALAAGVGIVAIAAFALHREPAGAPGPPRAGGVWWRVRSLLGRRDLWAIHVLGIILLIARTTVLAYLVLYFVDELGIAVLVAASFLAVLQVGGIVGRIGWGLISDHVFGGRRTLTAGLIGLVGTTGIAALSALPAQPAPALLAIVVFTVGLSATGHNGVYNTMLPEIAGPDAAGTALGLNKTIVLACVVAGTPLLGLLIDMTGRYRLAWLITAGMLLAGTLLFWWLLASARPARTETAGAE